MNTSELFFNTPVIDGSGHVKNLSDFGGGGGTLPIASADTLGGVKIGDGVNVAHDGTISVPPGMSVVYNAEHANNSQINFETIYPDGDAVLLIIALDSLYGTAGANHRRRSFGLMTKYGVGVRTFGADQYASGTECLSAGYNANNTSYVQAVNSNIRLIAIKII